VRQKKVTKPETVKGEAAEQLVWFGERKEIYSMCIARCCGAFNGQKMGRYLTILFCFFVTVDCFGQFESVSDFYRQMFEIEQLREFISKHATPLKDYRTRHDSTRIDTTYILNFDKHPNLDKSSGGGRLEFFNSIYADSTSVYEVSHRLYICFKKIPEAKKFLNKLRSQLKKATWREITKTTDTFEEYTIHGKEILDANGKPKTFNYSPYPTTIVFRLIPNKQTNECELYIGL
jgi:hypothetical protein